MLWFREVLASLCKQAARTLLVHFFLLWYLQSSCSLSQPFVYPEQFVPSPYFVIFPLFSQGQFVLLRDTRTDGSFLVHHFLSFYLRGGSAALLGPGTPPRVPQGCSVLHSVGYPWINTKLWAWDLWIPVLTCSWSSSVSLGTSHNCAPCFVTDCGNGCKSHRL